MGQPTPTTVDALNVAILMATHNGTAYLQAQLTSIAQQSHTNWCLIVSDDNSTDDTRAIITAFAAQFRDGKVRLIDGPCNGEPASNFLCALNSGTYPDHSYIAFCDQDDVWLPDRLERGLKALTNDAADHPSLYGSRTIVTDATLTETGLSPNWRYAPSFQNALVQNFAGGNTLLMCPLAGQLLRTQTPTNGMITAHDWWAYILVSGVGGHIHFDPVPTLYYRQHGRNVVGANGGWRAKLWRIRAVFRGTFKTWTAMHISALSQSTAALTPDAREALNTLQRIHNARGLTAMLMLRRSDLYRQTPTGHLALYVAAFFGKL
ncbi:glycosyltransferase family 2 protein [Celeribacter marinus]|uniref:glycosyltransferase family 2 protein n=1 Tax=Celeribacter marinus TaxID=1397108 RepID=UPI003F6C7F29